MTIQKLFLLIGAWLMTMLAMAQSSGSISGKIVEEGTEEGVPMATVRLLKKADSTFVTGKATDVNGKFAITGIANGSYIVHVSYVGFTDLYRNVTISKDKNKVALGTLHIGTDNILLAETVVTAKAPEISVKGDTIEYNADSYKVTESAVLEDLLKKMPGVEISTEGKITVNGKEVNKILVDGEEFFSDDPKVASKNLPAKMIQKLQVLDKKTEMAEMTGFDDGEEETVINLSVRPGMKEGLFGNAFAGYGSKNRYEANAMVNYMKDKDQYTFIGGLNNTNNAGFSDLASSMFGGGGPGGMMGWGGSNGITTSGNVGGNFSKQFADNFKIGGNARYGISDNKTTSDGLTQNLLSGGNTLEKESNRNNNKSQNAHISLRLEWEPDTLTKIIFRPSFSLFDNNRTSEGTFSTVREDDNDMINEGDSRYFSEGRGYNYGLRLDVSRELGKPGRVLSAEMRLNGSNNNSDGTNVSNTFYNSDKPDDIIDQRFSNNSQSMNLRGYVSYVEPLGRNNYLQLAYNYRNNRSESDRDTRSKDEAGQYTVLDSLYTKRLENNFTNHEMELNFRAMRSKYEYLFGISVQPSTSVSRSYIGSDLLYDGKQSVINYSPTAQLTYRWSRTHNLRIRYFGDTDQPSLEQLSPVVDVTNPLNISYGNPDLKPSFEHRLNIRYMLSNPEKASSFNAFINGGYMTNDIVSSTFTDIQTGRKETTYENVAGNWNINTRVMFNVPLKNIKYSIFSMSFAGYNHRNGFSNREKNLNTVLNLHQVLGLSYRSEAFDFTLRGNANYNDVKNTLEGQRDQNYLNYGGNASTTIYLPWDMSIESDINYSTNSGYSDGFQQNEWLWNASIQKQLFKQKNGTLRFKIYDILQQRSNISRSVTSNYIRDTTTNTLTSYFMVHFVYRFNIFKGGATAADMRRSPGRFHGPRM